MVFWGTLQGTASTTPPINGNASGVVSVRAVSVDILPDSLPLTFRPHHADDPRQNEGADGRADDPRQNEGADGRCSTQGAAEY